MKCAACDYEQPREYRYEENVQYPDWVELELYIRDLSGGGDSIFQHGFSRFPLKLVACPKCDTVRTSRE